MTEPQRTQRRAPYELGGVEIAPGSRGVVNIPVSVLADHTPVHLSAMVVHGRRPGPTMFVSAALHGDEVLGVEIVRRVLRSSPVARLSGTLIAVPVVNAFGFHAHSRYLPDRRDLNRSFPGSERGSLAARLAHLFLTEIVARCDAGIDLHTAAIHRSNLPQIRVAPGSPRIEELARAFGAPVIVGSPLRDGSLRSAAATLGIDVLLYEGGEGLRFDDFAIRAGVSGTLRVMRRLGLITEGGGASKAPSLMASQSRWLRAPNGGIARQLTRLGTHVSAGDVVGMVSDPFGGADDPIISDMTGLVIGRSNLPVVNEGDALLHIARIDESAERAEARVEAHGEQLASDPMFDEDEII